MLAGALGAVIAAGALVYLRVGPGAGTRPLTCAEAEPKRLAAEAATQQAYERALAAKRLTPVALEHVLFDGWHIEAERAAQRRGPIALDRMTIAVGDAVTDTQRECGNIDPLVDQALQSGEVFPLTYAGRQRSAIAGWFDVSSGSRPDAFGTELVADDAGGVWRVARAPSVTSSARYDVQACPWGCGGPPSPVPRMCAGGAWLLPDGRRYRGEMKIPYDAAVVDFNPIEAGLNCTLPP